MDEKLIYVQRRINDVRHNLAILLDKVSSYSEETVLDNCNELLNEADRKIEEIKKLITQATKLSN